jgi:hypothetical protein
MTFMTAALQWKTKRLRMDTGHCDGAADAIKKAKGKGWIASASPLNDGDDI